MNMGMMGFSDEASSLQPGMNIGSLHITGFIGKGGIGEVYRAQHEILGKEFAVKIIPKGFTGADDGNDIFKQAARIQTRLDHPNILRIDDLGEEELFYWLRMEYIEAEQSTDKTPVRSIGDLMRLHKSALSQEEVCYYLYYALIALDHAHGQGVVHCDLKPANLLIVSDGVKVSELGVVELIGHAWDDFHLLRHNPLLEPTPFDPLPGFSRQLPALLSTFEYFSPEQKAGQKPTPQSNLYSVGLIAYRMLTGCRTLSLSSVTEMIPGVNPLWDDWFRVAVAYDPDNRFKSASEMLEAMPGLESEEESQESVSRNNSNQ